MKVNGNGQGKILTLDELKLLFNEGLVTPRDRALFAICLSTGCRISEALSLQITDIKGGMITFRKSTTKGKLRTRVIDIHPELNTLLAEYLEVVSRKSEVVSKSKSNTEIAQVELQTSKLATTSSLTTSDLRFTTSKALFPGMRGRTPTLTRFAADKILRQACDKVGLVGVSTHSFRRTSLTMMSNGGVPLRVIQEISGHKDLGTLQRYLEVSPEQKRQAVATIKF